MSNAPITLWLTRPQHQAADIKQLLSNKSVQLIHQPAIAINPITSNSSAAKQVQQLVLQLDNFTHLIFISTNAVQHGMEKIENYWPQLPVDKHWYAIGKATAKALSNFGIAAQSPTGEQNSEALLSLAQLQNIRGDKVIIFSGVGGREHLAQELSKRGAKVSVAPCYTRDMPKLKCDQWRLSLQNEKINAIMAASVETAVNSMAMAKEEGVDINDIALIVPGQRVANAAIELGFTHVIKAISASSEAMVAALDTLNINTKTKHNKEVSGE